MEDYFGSKHRRNLVLVFSILALFAVYVYVSQPNGNPVSPSPLTPLPHVGGSPGGTTGSILPGFEGETNGLNGYQPSTMGVSTLGEPLMAAPGACSYSWVGTPTITQGTVKVITPSSSKLIGCSGFTSTDELQIDEQQNLQAYSSPYTTPITVSYFVPITGTTNWKYITGQVEEYTYNMNIGVESGSSGKWSFPGDTFWSNLASVIWNEASELPQNSSITGPAYETPLYGVVTNVMWTNQHSSQCSICVIGQSLSFYSNSSAMGQTLATLSDGQQPSAALNESLSLSTYSAAPDSRMSQLVYYPVSIEGMDSNCPIGGQCSYPYVTVSILLYTLRIGEYILTNPDKQALESRSQSCTGFGCVSQAFASFGDWLGSVGAFLSSPLGAISSSIFILIALAVVVFVALEVFRSKAIL